MKILKSSSSEFLQSKEFEPFMSELFKGVKQNVICSKVKPYKSVKIDFLAKFISSSYEETERMVGQLICDGKIDGLIDHVGGFLEMNESNSVEPRYEAL
jgi:COP9 signalosome complex subunit 2